MPLRAVGRLGIGAAATWAAINGVIYVLDVSKRYRAESAWFVFAAMLIAAALHAVGRDSSAPETVQLSRPFMAGSLIACLATAFALYWPMLSIGLLSDDYVLLARADAGVLVDSSWAYVRPLPLAIWRAISQLNGVSSTPMALHAFNVALHGANAWLISVLGARLGLDSRSALLAALVFVVFPASVEPVAWASGVFDVVLVTFILIACLAIIGNASLAKRTGGIAVITFAALATKETAVVLPGILAIVSYCARAGRRCATLPIAYSIVCVVLYLGVRAAAGFATTPPSDEFSGYAAKEIFSRPFGALGMPLHAGVVTLIRRSRLGLRCCGRHCSLRPRSAGRNIRGTRGRYLHAAAGYWRPSHPWQRCCSSQTICRAHATCTAAPPHGPSSSPCWCDR